MIASGLPVPVIGHPMTATDWLATVIGPGVVAYTYSLTMLSYIDCLWFGANMNTKFGCGTETASHH
jgi:hypothetical protein